MAKSILDPEILYVLKAVKRSLTASMHEVFHLICGVERAILLNVVFIGIVIPKALFIFVTIVL